MTFRLDDEGQPCRRICVQIDGGNYYVTTDGSFLHVTVPAENRPEREAERRLLEALCSGINDGFLQCGP